MDVLVFILALNLVMVLAKTFALISKIALSKNWIEQFLNIVNWIGDTGSFIKSLDCFYQRGLSLNNFINLLIMPHKMGVFDGFKSNAVHFIIIFIIN